MIWNLRREEVLDGEQLRDMLHENPRRAAQAILVAAKAQIVEAQALLGQILLDGQGIERDRALALIWFGIAARKGHGMAANMLGRCHEHGWGCLPNPAKAAQFYQQAAAAGLDWGLYNLGNLLATGRGIAVDQARALACYRRAAEMGHAKSLNLLGRYLEDGIFCPQDLSTAYDCYRRSAEGGDFRGQFSHAAVLADQGKIDEALHWLHLALAHGNSKFLRVSAQSLLRAAQPELRALSARYAERLAKLQGEIKLAPLLTKVS